MTDELRMKVDRLRLAACDPGGPLYGSNLVPLIDDVTTALLSAHPADDGEPADRAWLEALPRQQCDTFLWMKKVFNLPQQTKGHVRRLLEALGVKP